MILVSKEKTLNSYKAIYNSHNTTRIHSIEYTQNTFHRYFLTNVFE